VYSDSHLLFAYLARSRYASGALSPTFARPFSHSLEPLNNLSALLGGPKIWIKRDDATGLASGGNKTRKLEFLLADALEKKPM
jgi:hypothetical protein